MSDDKKPIGVTVIPVVIPLCGGCAQGARAALGRAVEAARSSSQAASSTVDADGTRREYTAVCHPELRPWGKTGAWDGPAQKLTSLNAIASTYGMTGEEYARLGAET